METGQVRKPGQGRDSLTEAARQLTGAAGRSEERAGKKLASTRPPKESKLRRRWPVEPRGARDRSVASTRSVGPACGRVGTMASEAVFGQRV